MADSATPRIAEPSAEPPLCLAVAYSGGRDSTALLHATARQAQALGLRVLALHVHHGLSVHADAWLAHCQGQCEGWAAEGLPLRLQWRRLDGQPEAGQSVEAWAREARHAALAAMAREAGADLLLLAHHRRDQAETLLLQALRGAGVAGLAGMPARQWRDGLCWARPWLDQPREAIEAYVLAHGLTHIEDDSNSDPRYARNRLRLSVWPSLAEGFPHAEASLAQAAGWAQGALALQREMAAADLAPLCQPEGLDEVGLRRLTPARASNALRAWLRMQLGQAAPASLVRRLLAEAQASAGNWPCVGGQIRRYRGRLCFVATAATVPIEGGVLTIDLNLPGLHPVPQWQGAWQISPVDQGGVPASLLAGVELRPRGGGEQFQGHARGLPRSLKKAYQTAAVPAWQRQGPLLFAQQRLLYVPGLGLDARALAAAGEPQLGLQWLADAVSLR
jgi:tRNA(Ile)-lysidine synthase